jgi:hypothetical protein
LDQFVRTLGCLFPSLLPRSLSSHYRLMTAGPSVVSRLADLSFGIRRLGAAVRCICQVDVLDCGCGLVWQHGKELRFHPLHFPPFASLLFPSSNFPFLSSSALRTPDLHHRSGRCSYPTAAFASLCFFVHRFLLPFI